MDAFCDHDVDLLTLVAVQLRKSCDQDRAVPSNNLPSIIHAFVTRLAITPPDLVRAIEVSLPRVIATMKKSDIVLAVPPLGQIPELRAVPHFRRAVFSHCASILRRLTNNAVVSIL